MYLPNVDNCYINCTSFIANEDKTLMPNRSYTFGKQNFKM